MPKKHKIQVIFNEKELKIGVKDRKNKHGVSVRKILETSDSLLYHVISAENLLKLIH